jgi:hypothetical protein
MTKGALDSNEKNLLIISDKNSKKIISVKTQNII